MRLTESVLQMFREYLGAGRAGRRRRIADLAALHHFIESRASHVAQTSLYGYLRTRAGSRYPSLFEDDAFLVSINIAKWQVWLACLSDLCVYAGGLVAARTAPAADEVPALMTRVLTGILDAAGTPAEAGPDFEAGANAVRERIAGCRFASVTDDDAPFANSPAALVAWAPIVEHLKALDAGIVENSVRFRWQEVRRALRRDLDADALMEEFRAAAPD